MDYIAPFLIISLLILITLRNGFETKRGLACIAVLWTTVPGYMLYNTELYFPIADTIGSYGYQSVTPVLSICALAFIRDKLSTVLMCLFCVLILGNIYFFWLEGQGYQIQNAHQSMVWAVFFIEVALMLSLRLTNGIHRAVQRFIDRGDPATDYGIGNVGSHLSKDNTGETSA